MPEPAYVVGGAVDRVDDPEACRRRLAARLFAEKPVLWKGAPQFPPDRILRTPVGYGDEILRALGGDTQRRRVGGPAEGVGVATDGTRQLAREVEAGGDRVSADGVGLVLHQAVARFTSVTGVSCMRSSIRGSSMRLTRKSMAWPAWTAQGWRKVVSW